MSIKPNLLPNDADNRSINCAFCSPKYEFKSNNDFLIHLKENHCKIINNNLLICEYGSNRKCQFLKNEPIEISIFNDHCLNRHLINRNNQIQDDRISLRSNASSDRLVDYNSTTLPFSSNLTAILSDPKKDRHKVHQIFTKTWGYDFIENPTTLHFTTKQLPNINITDFRSYLLDTEQRYVYHLRNNDISNESNLKTQYVQTDRNQLDNTDQIPKIFYDQKFSLENKETFNGIISNWKYFELNSNLIDSQKKIGRKGLSEKLTHYLDVVEMQISRQISTKANTFFTVLSSQEEVQEQITKTCSAVKYLRKNLQSLDKNNALKSIKLLQLVAIRSNYKNIIKRLELISSVHQTQRAIQSHLALSEYSGSLDLIKVSQEILSNELAGIHSLRHFSSQLNEIEAFIDKMLHDEYTKYIECDLSRDFNDGHEIYDKEKLTSLLYAVFRTKNIKFINLFKEEIMIYLKSCVKQTVVLYVAQNDDDDLGDDTNGKTLMDRVRQLVYQEFLLLLSRVLKNIKIMLMRVKSITSIFLSTLDSFSKYESDPIAQRQIMNESDCLKLEIAVKDLLVESTQYAQERIVKLLDGKNRDNIYEKLNNEEFVSLANILEEFMIDFDQIAEKKTSTLKSWLQNTCVKYLVKFHNEKKEKLTLALDNERWKVSEVSMEMQYLADHLAKTNVFGLPTKKTDLNQRQNDYIIVNSEKYVVIVSALVLVKIMVEYCQLSLDIPSLSFDIMTRLIEIFKIFNSRTCQLILGGGALQVSGLKLITIKHLGLMYRSLELEIVYIPQLKNQFLDRISEKHHSSLIKQFDQLIKDYQDHKNELNNKLLSIVDGVFIQFLSNYEVKAPVPSQSFKNICQQICKVHELLSDVLRNESLVVLFANIHEKFKERLKYRLKDLNVVNDGGPQHALIFSDMSYYLTQFKNLNGLHLIPLNIEDIWTT